MGGEGRTEDEVVGWYHGLNGREFEQTPGVGDGQGGLARCSARGHQESDTTEQLNNNKDVPLIAITQRATRWVATSTAQPWPASEDLERLDLALDTLALWAAG